MWVRNSARITQGGLDLGFSEGLGFKECASAPRWEDHAALLSKLGRACDSRTWHYGSTAFLLSVIDVAIPVEHLLFLCHYLSVEWCTFCGVAFQGGGVQELGCA